MTESKIIDGKAFAEGMRRRIAAEVQEIKAAKNMVPGLAVVLVGENPASQVYVRNKARQTKEVGMNSWEHRLEASTSQADLFGLIARLNAGLDDFLERHAGDGWRSIEDFRGIRRDRVVLQSEIRRPDASDYEGGYEHVEGYAAPTDVPSLQSS